MSRFTRMVLVAGLALGSVAAFSTREADAGWFGGRGCYSSRSTYQTSCYSPYYSSVNYCSPIAYQPTTWCGYTPTNYNCYPTSNWGGYSSYNASCYPAYGGYSGGFGGGYNYGGCYPTQSCYGGYAGYGGYGGGCYSVPTTYGQFCW